MAADSASSLKESPAGSSRPARALLRAKEAEEKAAELTRLLRRRLVQPPQPQPQPRTRGEERSRVPPCAFSCFVIAHIRRRPRKEEKKKKSSSFPCCVSRNGRRRRRRRRRCPARAEEQLLVTALLVKRRETERKRSKKRNKEKAQFPSLSPSLSFFNLNHRPQPSTQNRLLRHGRSKPNEAGLIVSSLRNGIKREHGLSATGREQAKEAG